ncbi:hypothetical protein NHX12_031008, partial [Muraenolepis orangiensis]
PQAKVKSIKWCRWDEDRCRDPKHRRSAPWNPLGGTRSVGTRSVELAPRNPLRGTRSVGTRSVRNEPSLCAGSALLMTCAKHQMNLSRTRTMSRDLKSVLVTTVLQLEEIDVGLYRGKNYWVPLSRRLFGGQIIGQALVAAAQSVDDHLFAHSLHCYFVRAGDPGIPVLYKVDGIRDGRSFCVRSVKAIQHGEPILVLQASFHMDQPSSLQHQFSMPEFSREVTTEPKRMFWVRARGHIGEGNMKLHGCVAAYISDFSFLGTMLTPYAVKRVKMMASLDHAMWFHNTFRTDEWMLYEVESPWAGGSRGLVQGRLWRRDGVLAASCSQEGLIRLKASKEQSKL